MDEKRTTSQPAGDSRERNDERRPRVVTLPHGAAPVPASNPALNREDRRPIPRLSDERGVVCEPMC